MIASPSIVGTHQAVVMNSRPRATIEPHAGSGGGTPAPRKLSEASTSRTQPQHEGGKHDNCAEDVRQDMPKHSSERPRTSNLGQSNVVALTQGEHLSTNDARESRPHDESDRDDDVQRGRAEGTCEKQREQEDRKADS